ncbi:MAG: cytosolic leucyl tRNA synthetase [Vezdaea aestivalis]|nr:MAG: cytosolic leucyl tRNA synthetase [Vezdaea aestivalis]
MAASVATAVGADAAKNTLKLENTEKRDALITYEKKCQHIWAEDGIFQPNAPSLAEVPFGSMSPVELRVKYPKFFGTIAYPYMNGTLHAGHCFSVSKVEFAAGFARMQGRQALFPLGFHCTGMPIKACADKLIREVEMFGQEFEKCPENDSESVVGDNTNGDTKPAPVPEREDVTKFTAKKGKAASKAVKLKYQFQIMLAIGIPLKEIHRFSDPQYWLTFFPPLCKQDLTNFGARIDWRRSFVTTDANPYYDAFVRWQMNRLKELEKIKYGERETIYSPKDGQPCMDHDRSEGEGVGPQNYVGIKLKIIECSPGMQEVISAKVPPAAGTYLVAATLRPETMYGQTCCFVSPKITYGIYKAKAAQYWIMTERAARNMAYQKIFDGDFGHYEKIADVQGVQMIGTLVHAPLSTYTDGVRVLPMETVLATKGTGVVTSVPSDSPDDFATVTDLAKKADFYKIKKEWAELAPVSIINTPSYGDQSAPFLVKKFKINSPKDTKQLAEAKTLIYKEGFYQGTMIIGSCKGQKVIDAKPQIQSDLVAADEAFAYSEPENIVVSRSADECVVAKLNQWFLNYGEDDAKWRDTTLDWITHGMRTYAPETERNFVEVVKWLNKWACARTYGLGSKLPFDPHFLVESLSDSTIYMAYYTIAHLLHADIYGKEPGLAGVKPEQMTDEVWDYVFARREVNDQLLAKSKVGLDALQKMRREFEYWYPLDIRVSGKDLIPNHLTFFIYIHLALFPKEYWPRGVRANGHLLLNGEKMSKSTGNFMTMNDLIRKYGADAARIALADAGDGIEDANFEETVANSSILRLYTLREWCEEMVKDQKNLRKGSMDNLWDKLFENELRALVAQTEKHYEDAMYKAALKSGLYDLTSARDFYREATGAAGIGMHRDLVFQYMELQALVLATIAPHWSEYIWLEVLNQPSTIQNQEFPRLAEANPSLSAAREYVRNTSSNITSAEATQQKKKEKGKAVAFDPKKPKQLTVFVAAKYPAWQEKYIDLIREAFDKISISINDKEINSNIPKAEMKKAMPFVQSLKRRLLSGSEAPDEIFNRKLAFDELDVLQAMIAGLKRITGCKKITIVQVEDGVGIKIGGEKVPSLPSMAESAVPGNPSFLFENLKES